MLKEQEIIHFLPLSHRVGTREIACIIQPGLKVVVCASPVNRSEDRGKAFNRSMKTKR